MADETKNIADMLTTVDDWLATMEALKQQPEFAHSEFFSLLAEIVDDARQGKRSEDLLHKCHQAADMAAELYKATGLPQFAEWRIGLADYARTWTDDPDPVLFANPLLQAEIAHLQEQAAEQNDPIKKFTSALMNVTKLVQESHISDLDSMQQAADAVKELSAPLNAVRRYVSLFAGTKQGDRLKAMLEETEAALQKIADDTARLVQGNLDAVLSYLDEEIKKPKYKGLSLKEIMEQSADGHGGYREGSLFMQACSAASKAMEQDGKEIVGDLIQIAPSKITGLEMNLAKISSDIFTNLQIASAERGNVDGQYVFSDIQLAVEKQGDKPRTLYYSAVVNNLTNIEGIDTALDDYDRRVGDSINTLIANGNFYFSASQLYSVMGNKGENINPKIIKRIDASMKKYASSWVSINQSEDYPAYINNTPFGVKYEGQLLYYETVEFEANGKTVEKGYHILKEPVLYTLGKARNQITTIPREVVATEKRQTKDYLKLQNYLLDRISRMKNEKTCSSYRILHDSLFERMGVSKATHKSKSAQVKRARLLATMYEELDHYKKVGWISGYRESSSKKGNVGVDIFI